MVKRRYLWCSLCLVALALPVRADPFTLKTTRTGNIQYVFVGAALADNQGLSNGVNCLLQSSQAVVSASMLSAHPKLVAATLYVSGSLIDDGIDYTANNLALFSPSTNASPQAQEQAARAAAAVSVMFLPPGATTPTLVSTTSDLSYVTVYAISTGPEQGNVGFFTTPIDVTALINGPGQGQMTGTYTLGTAASASNPAAGQVLADVCHGVEAICDSANPTHTCGSVSAIHTNGTASFGLLLIYEDLSLPLYSVSLFEGLQELSGSTQPISLVTGNPISNPASGALTYYVLEGDLSIGRADSTETCGGDEYVQVNGNPAPGAVPICLNDADNPVGNIFNGSINEATASSPPASTCSGITSCCGPHLCGLAGVDIDRYDISAALAPGATEIDITLGTGSDRVALASLVLGAQVFEAMLSSDTQFRTFDTVAHAARVGGQIIYSLAISNTGNIVAKNVQVAIDAPPHISGFEVLSFPPGATDGSSQTGANGTGYAAFSGFDVDPGKVQEVRIAFTTQCAQLDQTLNLSAQITAQNVTPFDVAAPSLTIGGPGEDACAGLDPQGPFADVDPVKLLRGGGCHETGQASWLSVIVVITACWLSRRRRHHAKLLALVMLMSSAACGNRHPTAPAAPPQNITSLNGLPGEPCGAPLMVLVTPTQGPAYCIDRFEASTDTGALGNATQNADDTSLTPDGSTRAVSQVALAVTPAHNLSWYQAKAACLNAGKRLCSLTEWEFACRSAQGFDYPYGETVNETACNGFFQYDTTALAVTGSFKACVSAFGVYDLSGNVEEWLDTAVPRAPDSTLLNDRATHGGSYLSNNAALACVGVQFHSPPNATAPDRGFRCCMTPP